VFDLLLEREDGREPAVVVEVKSTTATNEEKQLRLALGQVLRYRQLLKARSAEVVGFIAIEESPRDPSWVELCASAGVRLVWPATVRAALRALT
jgi:XisH protein